MLRFKYPFVWQMQEMIRTVLEKAFQAWFWLILNGWTRALCTCYIIKEFWQRGNWKIIQVAALRVIRIGGDFMQEPGIETLQESNYSESNSESSGSFLG